ncbi:Filaggrin-2 [Fukomys damarensis]|uniref:Filaggrin-2 n=1 Tax=Fukomys damarensis TaxID=885580 RepID=A0A091DKG2_FUKDA|nr:Filaggrin-2 [Fukomys damarensis]
MTDLLRSVVTVIDIFYKYTKQDGECGTLSKDELKELLEKEFRPILKNPDDPDTVDVIMHMLDRDHDRRLDFTEFLLMVFKLAMACNKVLSRKYCKASGSKKRRHGHQHQKEESETEEEEEETPRQKSGYRHSSWREGEEHGYASGGSRGTEKHSRGSNSRRLERQGQRAREEKVMVVCHMDWGQMDMNQTLRRQERMETKSMDLPLRVWEKTRDKVMRVDIAIQVGVEDHKMLLVLANQVDLEIKEISLAITTQVVNQEVVEDKGMDVSQEVIPLNVLNLSLDPVATLLVKRDMDIDNVANRRTVEDNRE